MANDAMPQWAGDMKRADAQLDALFKAKRDGELQKAIEKAALAVGSIQTANISNAMEELAQRTNKANQAAGVLGVQAPYSGAAQGRNPPKTSDGRFTDENMVRMLASRMGWNLIPGTLLPFDKCIPCKVTEDKAAVFIVTGGKAITIEDDLGLFPSDALITQLRLLEP